MRPLQTVPLQSAIEAAKPIKSQPLNKGRVWGILLLSAAALFGVTTVLENNEQLFPAIARANKAIAASRKQKVCPIYLSSPNKCESSGAGLSHTYSYGAVYSCKVTEQWVWHWAGQVEQGDE